MIPARILGFTRFLGAPKNWPESETCVGLAITDIKTEIGNVMQSAWEPTPDELDRLNAGAKVILSICGTGHPAVMLSVGPVTSVLEPEDA